MSDQPAIVFGTLIALWNANPAIFNGLPEFAFIVPVAKKIKAKGCQCGMGGEIGDAIKKFNQVIDSLSREQVDRFKTLLQRDKLIFGIQTPTSYMLKEYV